MYSSEFPTQTCPYQFTASPAGTEIHKLLYPAFITGFFLNHWLRVTVKRHTLEEYGTYSETVEEKDEISGIIHPFELC